MSCGVSELFIIYIVYFQIIIKMDFRELIHNPEEDKE